MVYPQKLAQVPSVSNPVISTPKESLNRHAELIDRNVEPHRAFCDICNAKQSLLHSTIAIDAWLCLGNGSIRTQLKCESSGHEWDYVQHTCGWVQENYFFKGSSMCRHSVHYARICCGPKIKTVLSKPTPAKETILTSTSTTSTSTSRKPMRAIARQEQTSHRKHVFSNEYPGYNCDNGHWMGEQDSLEACFDLVLSKPDCSSKWVVFALNFDCRCIYNLPNACLESDIREDIRTTLYETAENSDVNDTPSDSQSSEEVSEMEFSVESESHETSDGKEQWYFISSFTRSYADKMFAKRTPYQLYGHLPSLFIYRACYARRSGRYHLVHDTTDYAGSKLMPQTVRGPNPNKNWPNPVVPWSKIWNDSYTDIPVQMPPHWNKVFSMLNLIEEKGLTNDWMVWLDGDENMMSWRDQEDLELPKSVSVAFLPLENGIFWVRMNQFGRNFLQKWADLGQGKKTICEHRFAIPEYHDLFWFWATAWDTLDVLYNDGISRMNCSDLRPLNLKWSDWYVQHMRRYGTRIKFGVVLKDIMIMNNDITENWEFGRREIFVDYNKTIAIHSKHPFEGWLLRHECNRRRLKQCVEEHHCKAILLDTRLKPITSVLSRKTYTNTTLIGTCDADDHRPAYNFSPPELIYDNPDTGSGCAKPGCECWNCTCTGFANTNRTTMHVERINRFAMLYDCPADPDIPIHLRFTEDIWLQESQTIQLAKMYVPDPCGVLKHRQTDVYKMFEFEGHQSR